MVGPYLVRLLYSSPNTWRLISGQALGITRMIRHPPLQEINVCCLLRHSH
jgi:hypothetical protein